MIKVLIVEDDPMVAEINKSYLLKVSGFTLTGTVSNGEEALQFLKKHAAKVDLIMLDVFMPKLDGLAFLKSLKQTYPLIDIIMVTAAQSSKNIKLALSQGAVDYIIKPFTFERMSTALLNYRNRQQILNACDSMEQTVLDKQIFGQSNAAEPELPKGVEKQTLALVRETASRQTKPFSTQELSEEVGISRISLRKYLSFLEDSGVLQSELLYRSKGRPLQMYHYVKK